MKIIFFGSDNLAARCLQELVFNRHAVVACVTQPDKPKGRGMHLGFSAVKQTALTLKLPVLQPADAGDPDFVQLLKDFEADLFVVVAYGRILPQSVLDVPKLFAINVHTSLLPKYRGAAPINWAILHGDKSTGVTIIKINDRMDAGDIIVQQETDIRKGERYTVLKQRLAEMGALSLVETIDNIKENSYQLIPQREEDVTFAPKLTKELGRIDWSQPANKIHDLVRGLLP